MCIAIGAMALGLVGCEPTTFGKKNVLINLAELGESINGKSIEEIDEALSKRGFKLCCKKSTIGSDYYSHAMVYSKGIQLDSTLINAEDKIRQQIENATILTVQFYSEECNHLEAMLYACYILPEETTESYKISSERKTYLKMQKRKS